MTRAVRFSLRLFGVALLILTLLLTISCSLQDSELTTADATADATAETPAEAEPDPTEPPPEPPITPETDTSEMTPPPDESTAAHDVTTAEPLPEENTEPDTEPDSEVITEPPEVETIPPERIPDGTLPFVPDHPEAITNDWKAIWISQFDLTLMYLQNGAQRPEDDFRKRVTVMMDNIAADGFNTVILQLRPYGDSMYPSELFPPSRYCVGSYAGSFLYDPIPVLLELCKERGLSVHGWINPLRAMMAAELQQVDDRYPIKQWYNDPSKRGDYLVETEGRWYLNPAHSEVRRLICDGAAEILTRYDLDGIHMDDYFYPTTDAVFDMNAYSAYQSGGGTLSLADWRRDNLNKLVSELYATVKTYDLRALFGISPSGVLTTVYNNHYADVYKWCSSPGYVDYICPQVYFGFEHATCPFDEVCELWQDLIQTDYVSLVIGMTFGKAAAGIDEWAGAAGKDEWSRYNDILLRSLQYTETLERCVGVTVFCYQHLFDLATGEILEASLTEHTLFTPYFKEISWHTNSQEDTSKNANSTP